MSIRLKLIGRITLRLSKVTTFEMLCIFSSKLKVDLNKRVESFFALFLLINAIGVIRGC